MSNHEFENYLALVSRLLRLSRSQKEMIRDELHDHLETRVSELIESGVDSIDAMRQALEEFGDAALLAQKFQSVFHVNQRRWMMRFATFSIAGTFVAAVLVMAMWPSPARFGAPSAGIAQTEDELEDELSDASIQIAAETTTANSSHARTESVRINSSEDVHEILQRPCAFAYSEVPYQDVMHGIQEKYDVNVLLDYSAIDDCLNVDTLISFAVRNVRLSTALRLMLKEHNATYMIHDGILRIISLDVASDPEYFSRRIFDCRELLKKIADTDDRVGNPVRIKVLDRNQGGGLGGGSGGGGGGVFNVIEPSPLSETVQLINDEGILTVSQYNELLRSNMVSRLADPQESVGQNETRMETDSQVKAAENQETPAQHNTVIVHAVTAESILSNLIRMSIDPDGWDNTNGDGTLGMVSGFMVVTQSQETLDEIDQFIDELEKRIR